MKITFPFRPRCEWRKKTFPLVQQAYRDILPAVEQITVDTDHEVFNRAAARNKCVRMAGDGVVVIADADILPNREALLSAIEAAKDGGMHLGYDYYRALMRESTERLLLRGGDPDTLPISHDSTDSTAGIIVIRADEWWKAGGMDERFHGWGAEDTAFACQARTLLGPLTWHKGVVNHLWHPSEVRVKSHQYQRNMALLREYEKCEGDPDAIQTLIGERDHVEFNID